MVTYAEAPYEKLVEHPVQTQDEQIISWEDSCKLNFKKEITDTLEEKDGIEPDPTLEGAEESIEEVLKSFHKYIDYVEEQIDTIIAPLKNEGMTRKEIYDKLFEKDEKFTKLIKKLEEIGDNFGGRMNRITLIRAMLNGDRKFKKMKRFKKEMIVDLLIESASNLEMDIKESFKNYQDDVNGVNKISNWM